MGLRNKQGGASILGILVIVALLSFFLTVVIRLLPTFMESRTIRSSLETIATSSNSAMPIGEIRKKITNTFSVNRIEALDPKAIKVYRDKGKIIIVGNYETRTKLFEGVDAVMMFDNLTFTVD